jgi:hypothetical protein
MLTWAEENEFIRKKTKPPTAATPISAKTQLKMLRFGFSLVGGGMGAGSGGKETSLLGFSLLRVIFLIDLLPGGTTSWIILCILLLYDFS